MITTKTKNFNCIDLIKFICAILVFFGHVPPFYTGGSNIAPYLNFGVQRYLCRITVPFYFVCSGFFLFRKMPFDQLNTELIKTYCFKILRLIGIWSVLLVMGGIKHLWYMGATVIAITFLSICLHYRMKYKYLLGLACLLYLVGLLGDSYYGIIAPLENISIFNYLFAGYNLIFETTRNGIFMGFPFVLMGAFFAYRNINIKPPVSFIGFVISMLCLLGEVFLLQYNNIPRDYNMYVFSVPAVFFLFAFSLKVQLKDRSCYKSLRNMGMLIYFSHIMIYYFVYLAFEVLNKRWGINPARYGSILTLFVTLLFAFGIERLSHRKAFSWLKWLLS